MIEAGAIILAGGKGKRLGMNKVFVKLAKGYLVETVVMKLREIFAEIIIVTNAMDYQRLIELWKERTKPTILKDKIPDKGPLGGLYTGLLSLKNSYAFVCACDMPFLNLDLIKYIFRCKDHDYDAIVPESSPGKFEMLHSFYNKNCLNIIERNLKEKKLALRELLPFLNVFYVLPEKIKKFDQHMESFTNINTRVDLEGLKWRSLLKE